MVLVVGEILVDIFLENNKKEVFPGGAPFNVASNLASFNNYVSFYGAVGDDEYGHFLKDVVAKKINNYLIDVLSYKNTTKAIVTLKDGERSFRFERENGSDYVLDISNLKEFDLSSISIFHIGSLMLSFEEGRKFFFESIKYIRENSNALISFDVNYRDDIFVSSSEAKEIYLRALKEVDIIKFSHDELALLSDKNDLLEALKVLLNENQKAFITLGAEGSIYYDKNHFIKVDSFKLNPIDTTGAGDAFYSYILHRIDNGLDFDDVEEVKNSLTRANIVGALATQKKGAIDVVPTHYEIEQFLLKR